MYVSIATYSADLVDGDGEGDEGDDEDAGSIVDVLIAVPQNHAKHLEHVERIQDLSMKQNNIHL